MDPMLSRAVDILVAKKVFGWEVNKETFMVKTFDDRDWEPCPQFSTDASAATRVIDKMNSMTSPWREMFNKILKEDDPRIYVGKVPVMYEFCSPHQICNAALDAIADLP